MNKKQLIVLWIGIAVFVLIALITKTSFGPGGVWNPPVVVDYGPLVIRLMSTVIVTGGLIYTLKDKKDEKPKDK